MIQDELEQDVLCEQLKEAKLEVKRSKEVAFAELVKRKELESEVAEAVNRVSIDKISVMLHLFHSFLTQFHKHFLVEKLALCKSYVNRHFPDLHG